MACRWSPPAQSARPLASMPSKPPPFALVSSTPRPQLNRLPTSTLSDAGRTTMGQTRARERSSGSDGRRLQPLHPRKPTTASLPLLIWRLWLLDYFSLGMMPKRQATPEQVESYMNQERSKRREMLQKYLDHCGNFQVNVDVYLIESDQVADAIVELIPVLTIKQLVLGVSKSNLRKLKKGNTIAAQVQKNAPLYCEVKTICEGKEVTAVTTDPTPPFSPSPVHNGTRSQTPTPPSSTPNHESIAGIDEQTESKIRERKKLPNFLRCLSS